MPRSLGILARRIAGATPTGSGSLATPALRSGRLAAPSRWPRARSDCALCSEPRFARAQSCAQGSRALGECFAQRRLRLLATAARPWRRWRACAAHRLLRTRQACPQKPHTAQARRPPRRSRGCASQCSLARKRARSEQSETCPRARGAFGAANACYARVARRVLYAASRGRAQAPSVARKLAPRAPRRPRATLRVALGHHQCASASVGRRRRPPRGRQSLELAPPASPRCLALCISRVSYQSRDSAGGHLRMRATRGQQAAC